MTNETRVELTIPTGTNVEPLRVGKGVGEIGDNAGPTHSFSVVDDRNKSRDDLPVIVTIFGNGRRYPLERMFIEKVVREFDDDAVAESFETTLLYLAERYEISGKILVLLSNPPVTKKGKPVRRLRGTKKTR